MLKQHEEETAKLPRYTNTITVRPSMQNLFSQFAAGFPADRSAPCLITPTGKIFTYADVERESARIAHWLGDRGLVRGDRVTVQAPKSPLLVFTYLACLRAGLIYHPLNDAYTDAEVDWFLADARPSLAICAPEQTARFKAATTATAAGVMTADADGTGTLADAIENSPPEFATVAVGGDAVAVLLYSSGTTGQPKGAMLTHGNLAANTCALVETWGFTASDCLLHALPIYHAHGLFVGLGCALLSGSRILFMPRFDAAAVSRALPDATVMMGVPTYYTRLLDEPSFDRACCRNMRLFISGSAPLRAETHAAFLDRSGHAILERYGMTETSMLSSNPLDGERRPGSVGLPLPGVSMRIVDDADRELGAGRTGHIQVQGPNVFPGYWQRPDRHATDFTRDGFFRTGDLGCIDPDGYLTILGRDKDMIISGGLNVYPREVEAVIDALPGVVESAVVGVPHPDLGEAVIAVVVADQSNPPSESAVREGVRAKLASFKVPKRVVTLPELPRNALAKIQKNELRERFATLLKI